jgi:hypothetical protein
MQSRRGTHTGSQNATLNGTAEIIWEAFRAFGSLCSAGRPSGLSLHNSYMASWALHSRLLSSPVLFCPVLSTVI